MSGRFSTGWEHKPWRRPCAIWYPPSALARIYPRLLTKSDPLRPQPTWRLGRLCHAARQVQRLERNTGLTTEALSLFIRFWLSVTPPLPDEDQAAAQVKGRKRYEGFVETLGRRYASGKSLIDEIPEDVLPKHPVE